MPLAFVESFLAAEIPINLGFDLRKWQKLCPRQVWRPLPISQLMQFGGFRWLTPLSGEGYDRAVSTECVS